MKLSKWQALGNDYLLVEQAELTEPLTPDRVRSLCDYHFGVGSDGLLELLAVDGTRADVKIWNPDGSLAELSGNGARIVAAWLSHSSGSPRVSLRVGARELAAAVGEDGLVRLDVGRVEVAPTEILELESERIEFTPVSVGNPHAVVRREPERGELRRLGPRIERHSRFPERTNVQLVRVDGHNDLTVGVWERGAGETLASGTSAVAAAAAAVANGWCESPMHVHLPGGDLLVELHDDGRATLTGPAVEICRVELV
jgi:diaminopimelate epimerase